MSEDLSKMGEAEKLLYLANMAEGLRLTSGGHLATHNPSMIDMVREFHEKHGLPVREDRDIHVDPERAEFRYTLMYEEFSETLADAKTVTEETLPQLAKEMADAIYVILGTALEFGIPMEDVFKEVHRSNMSKDIGGKRGDGKVLKGSSYRPADVPTVLRKDEK